MILARVSNSSDEQQPGGHASKIGAINRSFASYGILSGMARAITLVLLFFEIVLLPWLASGCSRAPSFDILGSFFPAWLICLVIGILLATLARSLLLRQQIAVVWPILVYPSLVALFTFLFWLTFFS